MKFNIFGWFAAAAALLTTACERDPLNEAGADDRDYVAVTFTLQPEGLSKMSRADADDDYGKPDGKVDYSESHISDGTKADVLIYAVYDENDELLSEFGQVERGEETCTLPDGTELGIGQTLKKVDTFPVKITVNVKRDKTYKFAFWAQSSKCAAYDVHDLKKVKIHYTEIETDDENVTSDSNASSTPNNDEMRDAFCKVEELTISNKSVNNTVIYLRRPLAQINVGTTGYDYETIVQDEEMNYAYTRIQIAAAPRYLNVVEDKIVSDGDKDNKSVLEYGWALIPAYTNAAEAEKNPNWAEKDAKIFNEIKTGNYISAENLQHTYDWEEFLKVKIPDLETDKDAMEPDDKGYLRYAGLENNNKKTETFKYLSMCYVLAPESDDPEHQATFDRVRVWIAKDKTGKDEKQIIDLTAVPATRNWRTNIIGNILTTDVPFEIRLDPIYAGDYNGSYQNGNASWSGPLNGDGGGVSYDAENDEILISNVKGLLWFQQMVNGDLKYRNDATRTVAGVSVNEGQPIEYYDEAGNSHTFVEASAPYYFKGIPDPTKDLEEGTPAYEEAAMLKERILIATHQKTNKGYDPDPKNGQTWPKYNNFHFVGTKENGEPDPAKVKLVADIDLSGIEWLSIGFDCKMEQVLDMLGDNNDDNRNDTNSDFIEPHSDKTTHRGFFGHFDGNGHTVSNLKTKRFSINVHPKSLQVDSGGPYEAVQWFARGFFGQLGGTATVENLTLRNVDIYGFNCVGGIAGAAIGVKGGGSTEGTKINIDNCVVADGKIECVPMYRGDAAKGTAKNNRTFARGVNTGGIVGLYNASGSVTNCQVSGLSISGYRITGGIVGCIADYYFARTNDAWSESTKKYTGSQVKMERITGNSIINTIVVSDHFKPFDTMKLGKYTYNYTKENGSKVEHVIDWAYGFAWSRSYSSFLYKLVGGEYGGPVIDDDTGIENYNNLNRYVQTPIKLEDNTLDGCQLIDFACDLLPKDKEATKFTDRQVLLDNAPVDILPVLNNWFVDKVEVLSNLVGNAAAYKRYTTYNAEMFTSTGVHKNVMWNLPKNYTIDWHTNSGAVGMRVGAVELEGHDKVLSVRGVTGTNDCAMQISSCNRDEFIEQGNTMPDKWNRSATSWVKNLSVRGNPYAFTGICLSPNICMDSIKLEKVSVYDCYQTIALDNLPANSGNVWPTKVAPENVVLTVEDSDLRGYTTPGAGWKQVEYNNVMFETGAFINSNTDADQSKRSTCDVEAKTTFKNCKFKAPFTIEIKTTEEVVFDKCEIDGPKQDEPKIDNVNEGFKTLPEGTKKIVIDAAGEVTYYGEGDAQLEA